MARFYSPDPLQPVDYGYKFPFLETFSVLKGRQDLIDKQQETGNAALDWMMKLPVDPKDIPTKNQKILEYKSRYDKANDLIAEDPSNISAYQKEIRNTTREAMGDEWLQRAPMNYAQRQAAFKLASESKSAQHNILWNQQDAQWSGTQGDDGSWNMWNEKFPKTVYDDTDIYKAWDDKFVGVKDDMWKGFSITKDEKGNPYLVNSEVGGVSRDKVLEIANAAQRGIYSDSAILQEAANQLAYQGLEVNEENLKKLIGEVYVNDKKQVTVTPGSIAEAAMIKRINETTGSSLSGYPGWDYGKAQVTAQGDAITTLPSQTNDKFSSSQIAKDIKYDPITGAVLPDNENFSAMTLSDEAYKKARELYPYAQGAEFGKKVIEEEKKLRGSGNIESKVATLEATKANIANQFSTPGLPVTVTNAQANKVIQEIFDPRAKDKDNTVSLRTYNPKQLEYQYAPDKKNNFQLQRTEATLGFGGNLASGDIYTREVIAPWAKKDPNAANSPQPAANILNDNSYVTSYQKTQAAVTGIISPINPHDGLYIGEVISIPDAESADDTKTDAGVKYMYALPNQSKVSSADRQMFTELHNASQGLFDDTYTKVVGPYNDADIPEDRLMKSANTPVEIEQYLFLPAVGEEFANVPEDRKQDVVNAAAANDIYYAITPKPVIQQNLAEEPDSPNRYSFAKQMAGDVYAYYKKDDKFYPVLDKPITDVNTLEQLYLTKAKSIFLK